MTMALQTEQADQVHDADSLFPQARWRKRNPKAYWAHRATQSPMKSCLLEKRPCEGCGEVKADHDRPLFVECLCRKHHRVAHAEMRQGS